VDKVMGDAIVALFGTPLAHEDDAERAVRAGLAMRRTLDAYAGEAGVDVRMRIGINTGEVLVGALRAGGDSTVMGDVVNTASRLQTAAAPGQILVGSSTYAATQACVRYEPLGSLRARNRQEPVDVWAALEVTAPPGYRRSRTRSPLVGRDAELGLLEHTLGIATSRRRPNLVLLLGEAGVGKSRLAEELAERARCDHEAVVLEGRCVPYGEANIWWPVAEAIRTACGVSDQDSAETALRKCAASVATAMEESPDAADVVRIAHGLLYIMGHERPELSFHDVDPTRAREEALRSVRLFIEALARNRLVVIVLSELHWGDPALLGALDKFLCTIRNAALIVVATARPELEGRWQPASGAYNLVTLKLDPLDDDAALEMIEALCGTKPPAALRDLLLGRSGGNPFFLEELVALLTEAGVLVNEDGQVRLTVSRDLGDVPPTLRGLVAARLDALSQRERSVLEDAAVIGRTGHRDAIASLAASRGEEQPGSILDALVSRDLLVLDQDEYGFKSELVREIAYETLTKAERARRHARIADWLAKRARDIDREDEYLEQIAHHYGVSADFNQELGSIDGVREDIRERALAALERAAARAESRDSEVLAEHLLDHAYRLVASEPGPRRRALLVRRARARAGLRDLKGAREDVELVLDEAEESGDRPALAAALTVLGEIEHHEGAGESAIVTLERAVGMWREIGDDAGTAEALRRLGESQMFQGRNEDAERATSEALTLFRRIGDRRSEAWGLRNLAWIAFMSGDFATAEQRLHASAAKFEEIDDRGGLNWAIGFLAWLRFMAGRLDEAESLVEPVFGDPYDLGDPFAVGMLRVLVGHLRIWRGHIVDGVSRLEEALDIFRTIGDAWGEVQALIPLAMARTMLGRVEDGFQASREAVAASAALPDPRMRVFARQSSATLAAATGDAALAERELNAMREIFDGDDVPRWAEAHTLRALVGLQLGRVDEALQWLKAIGDSVPSEGMRANLSGIGALANAAAGRPDEAVRVASEVDGISGGTFRDRIMAWMAKGLALAQLDRFDDAEAAFAAATGLADRTDARLEQTLVRLAHARALEVLGSPQAASVLADARSRLTSMHVAAVAWDALFMRAASGA
jgi:tetratricopeptide (TPR) repeat protein